MEHEVVMSDEARLTNTLMQRYEKIGQLARPVKNSSTIVKVSLSLMLYQLINVDESEQFITLKLWIHIVSSPALCHSLECGSVLCTLDDRARVF